MIDGTGVLGSCRATVGREVKLACMDCPEFDCGQVDILGLMERLRTYWSEERQSLNYHRRTDANIHRCRLEDMALEAE